MSEYNYVKEVNVAKLEGEIEASSITIALGQITLLSDSLSIVFKAALSQVENDILDALVANHVNTPDVATVMSVLIEQPKDTLGYPIIKFTPFSDAVGFRFRGASFSGIAIAEATTDIDYLLTAERWINGGILLLQNHNFNDSYVFQVVDKDNVLGYGAGVVLDEFIKDYFVDSDNQAQQQLMLDYPARIYAGLYLRLKYTSVGTTNVNIKCNLFLHWKAV
jgi:hypothetical protein